jgi:galactonate dehydratase
LKVTHIDTVTMDNLPNLLFVEVATDEGLVGLGETFWGASAIDDYIHHRAAPLLLGENPMDVERHTRRLKNRLGNGGTGVEMRGNSAVNIALWDIAGKVSGQPLYQLLGGRSRESVRVYNTCAGSKYVRDAPEQTMRNWGIGSAEQYEDLYGFLHHADELSESLLAEGIDAMKIWPFDSFAELGDGRRISAEDLATALEPFEKIRSRVGSKMDIMVEMHSLWDIPTAKRIILAVEPFDPFWVEDPVPSVNPSALARLARDVRPPLAVSETLGGVESYLPFVESGGAEVVLADVGWVGGISEAKRVAMLADLFQVPVSFHDCTGPVVLTVSTHMAVSMGNACIQEVVRAFYKGWYRDLVTTLPLIENGVARPPSTPGIGTELLPDIRKRPGSHVRSSWLADL